MEDLRNTIIDDSGSFIEGPGFGDLNPSATCPPARGESIILSKTLGSSSRVSVGSCTGSIQAFGCGFYKCYKDL